MNGVRSNNPFAEIDDDKTKGWWHSQMKETQKPLAAKIDDYSESTPQNFEPRESQKGNVARALLYFWVIYGQDGITPQWIDSQISTLAQWHVTDPVDQAERDRSAKIRTIQGNDNPFVLDETLVGRVLGNSLSSPRGSPVRVPVASGVRSPGALVPIPARVSNRPSVTAADKIRVVTWNAKELFSPQEVESRRQSLKKFAQELKPDILLIQEVTSEEVVRALQDAMGLTDYYVACSDFTQDDTQRFASFEVGLISKFPLDQIIEYDPSPDNAKDNDPDEAPLPTPLLRLGIQPQPTFRGYLWARIDQVNLTVAVVHLKSSRGRIGVSDENNAKEREFVMAAVAAGVNEDETLLPGYSHIVGGDFNVGNNDKGKLGKNLMEDCLKRDCAGADCHRAVITGHLWAVQNRPF